MKYLFILTFLLSIFSNFSFADTEETMSISVKPFKLRISILKNDFPVNFDAKIDLVCMGIVRYSQSDGDEVRVKLNTHITTVAETQKSILYLIEYQGYETLENSFDDINYRSRKCYIDTAIRVEDSSVINDQNAPVWALANFLEIKNFDHLSILDSTTFKYFYSWDRYNEGTSCSYKAPNLCRKFLNVKPLANWFGFLNLLDLVASESQMIFPKP